MLTLRDRFPGAELVFDAISPFELWVGNLRLAISKLGARAHWGLRRGQELEGWGDGIRLLDEWGFCDDPTPWLDSLRRWLVQCGRRAGAKLCAAIIRKGHAARLMPKPLGGSPREGVS